MKKKSIKLNAILNTAQTIISILVSIITFPYISRVLGVEEIGRYNFSLSFVNYFALLAALGVSTYAIREGTQYRNDKNKLNKFCSEVFTINMYSTIVAYALLFLSVVNIDKLAEYKLLIGVLSIEIIFSTLGLSWVYSIYEDFFLIAIRTIAIQLGCTMLLFVFVKSPNDVIVYCIITAMTRVINNVVNMFFIKKYCNVHLCKLSGLKKHIKPIVLVFATTAAITIYVQSDIIILGFLSDDYHVGIYSVATKIYNVVKQLIAAILFVTIPRFSYYSRKNMLIEFKVLFNKILNIMIIILLPSMVGIVALSKNIICMAAGMTYIEADYSLKILGIAMTFNLLEFMYGYCVLIPQKKETVFFYATVVGAITNIILNFILIPLFLQNAAAFTTLLSEVVTMIVCIINSPKLVDRKETLKNAGIVLLGCVMIIFTCFYVNGTEYNLYMKTILSVALGCLIYTGILLFSKNKYVYEIISKRGSGRK